MTSGSLSGSGSAHLVRPESGIGESTGVLVHGAWHTGRELEPPAASIAAAGDQAFTPTIIGNRSKDPKTVGLNEAIDSVVAYLADNGLGDIVLMGHSYGGMIITAAADRVAHRIRRLVYWNAFVPNDASSIWYRPTISSCLMPALPSGATAPSSCRFSIWREAFINDADPETAKHAYRSLNPHPLKTLTDRILLQTNPCDMTIPKSYVNCTEDISLHPDYRWHPRLSQKLGSFRLIQIPGSHELCFSDPARPAWAIMAADGD